MPDNSTPATIDLKTVLAVLRGLQAVCADAPSATQAIRFILGRGAVVDADLLVKIAKRANVHLVRITAPQSVIAPDLTIPPDHPG